MNENPTVARDDALSVTHGRGAYPCHDTCRGTPNDPAPAPCHGGTAGKGDRDDNTSANNPSTRIIAHHATTYPKWRPCDMTQPPPLLRGWVSSKTPESDKPHNTLQ